MQLEEAIASVEDLLTRLKAVRDTQVYDYQEYLGCRRQFGEDASAPDPFPEVFCHDPTYPEPDRISDPVWEFDLEPICKQEDHAILVDKPHKNRVDAYALILRVK